MMGASVCQRDIGAKARPIRICREPVFMYVENIDLSTGLDFRYHNVRYSRRPKCLILSVEVQINLCSNTEASKKFT